MAKKGYLEKESKYIRSTSGSCVQHYWMISLMIAGKST